MLKKMIKTLLVVALLYPFITPRTFVSSAEPLVANSPAVMPSQLMQGFSLMTVDIQALCQQQDWVIGDYNFLPFAQSEISLPNRQLTAQEKTEWIADYHFMQGPSAFELETIRIANEVRTSLGLAALQFDPQHAMAARFYAQTMDNLNTTLSHFEGPYGGSAGVGSLFGVPSAWTNGSGPHPSAEQLVQAWLNSPEHCRNLLQPEARFIGTGSYGTWRRGFHYAFITTNPGSEAIVLRHRVNVENGTGGGEFKAGETVSIAATVSSGYQFSHWEGDVSFANPFNTTTTFIMADQAVTVRAIFIPQVNHNWENETREEADYHRSQDEASTPDDNEIEENPATDIPDADLESDEEILETPPTEADLEDDEKEMNLKEANPEESDANTNPSARMSEIETESDDSANPDHVSQNNHQTLPSTGQVSMSLSPIGAVAMLLGMMIASLKKEMV